MHSDKRYDSVKTLVISEPDASSFFTSKNVKKLATYPINIG